MSANATVYEADFEEFIKTQEFVDNFIEKYQLSLLECGALLRQGRYKKVVT